ncbi:MAG TPA: hypothetical protein VFZ26_19275 [Gemmatimonadales bacterium]
MSRYSPVEEPPPEGRIEPLHTSEARWRTLLEINNAIITDLTRDGLLQSVSRTLARVIPFDRAALTLYNPARETFRYLAMQGSLPSAYFRAGLEFHRSETMATQVFDRQRPVLRRDLEKEQQYPNDRRLVAEGVKTDCLVPLIVRTSTCGRRFEPSTTSRRSSAAAPPSWRCCAIWNRWPAPTPPCSSAARRAPARS